jgi:hypothetical protein
MLKEVFGDALGLAQTYIWYKYFKKGWMTFDYDKLSE